jgi:hypothetical protein
LGTWLQLQELLRQPRETEWTETAADHLAKIRHHQIQLGVTPWTADDYFWKGFFDMEGEGPPSDVVFFPGEVK